MRYILPACSEAAGRNIEQTFAILDAKGVGLRHLSGAVKKMLQQIIQVGLRGSCGEISAGCLHGRPWVSNQHASGEPPSSSTTCERVKDLTDVSTSTGSAACRV